MPKAGDLLVYREELADTSAVSGRRVQITATGTAPQGTPRVSLGYPWRQLAQATVYDQELTETKGVEVREAPGGASFDLTVRGKLRSSWASVADLRDAVSRIVEGAGFRADAADVSLQDFDGAVVTKTYTPTFTGAKDVNPDGSINYGYILEESGKETAANVGKAYGAVGKGIGEAAKGALGGLFAGLGPGWSIAFLVLAFLVAAVVAMFYLRPLMGA